MSSADALVLQAMLDAANERIHPLEGTLDRCRWILDEHRHSNGATPLPRLETRS